MGLTNMTAKECLAYLRACGIPQARIAQQLGVSKRTIEAWASGARKPKLAALVWLRNKAGGY